MHGTSVRGHNEVNFKNSRCKLTLMETMRRNTVAEDIELDRIQVKFVFANLLLENRC